MRVTDFCFALCAIAVGSLVVHAQSDPAAIVASAREVLGGPSRISSLKSLVITGRTRQLRGDNLIPIEFEIDLQLPDKYVRRDEIPAQESGPTARGFNGADLIQIPLPGAPGSGGPGSRSGMPPPPPGAGGRGAPAGPGAPGRGGAPLDPVAALKQDVARLTLGLFASTFDIVPLAFAYAGPAEAPEGTADAIDVTGPSNFTGRLFINRQSHLPLMLSWSGPATPAGPSENRLYYADYRDVDGFRLPFRLRRAIGANTIEETTIDRYRINARIDPKRFEVRK